MANKDKGGSYNRRRPTVTVHLWCKTCDHKISFTIHQSRSQYSCPKCGGDLHVVNFEER